MIFFIFVIPFVCATSVAVCPAAQGAAAVFYDFLSDI
jgi:hypothetical protein